MTLKTLLYRLFRKSYVTHTILISDTSHGPLYKTILCSNKHPLIGIGYGTTSSQSVKNSKKDFNLNLNNYRKKENKE